MFFTGWKIDRAVSRALEVVANGGAVTSALEALDALAEKHRGEALAQLGRTLRREEHHAAARTVLQLARERSPHPERVLLELAELEIDDDDEDAAIAVLKEALELDPRNEACACRLADLLLASGDVDDAIASLRRLAGTSPGVMVSLAQALAAQEQQEEALALAGEARTMLEAELKRTMYPNAWQAIKERYDEATRLWSALTAEAHGAEHVIEEEARAAKLDGRAGVNYRLLGAAAAARSPRIAATLDLESAQATETRARAILAVDRASVSGLSLLGCARLRTGDLDDARHAFERARSRGVEHFPALLGLGAVLDHERYGLISLSRRLPETFEDSSLGAIIPDWPHLTEREQRVVCASASPLRPLFPQLISAGSRMKILPIDVRVTDLPEFADLAGLRVDDDHRSYDAITGVAHDGCAVARIEELCDITSSGWTFAHELAHLAFFAMRDHQRQPFLRLHEEAADRGYAAADYDLKNPDEFFACSYTDFLCWRYGLPLDRELDEEGLLRAVFDAFDAL